MQDRKYSANYKDGVKAADQAQEKDIRLLRSKGGYELWIASAFGAIVKTGEKPRFERRIAGMLVYDWNALTGDNLPSLEDESNKSK